MHFEYTQVSTMTWDASYFSGSLRLYYWQYNSKTPTVDGIDTKYLAPERAQISGRISLYDMWQGYEYFNN